MIDEEIRRLERALAADPSDAVALEALAAARTRAGRGWADEPLPLDLRCSPKERGVYVWTRRGLGLEMVRVPEARFSDVPAPSEARAFFVGRYPVTRGEFGSWRKLMGRLAGAIESRVLGAGSVRATPDKPVAQADHPVVSVTHAEAVAFVEWAGLRLPTATEWERAALGDETTPCPCDGPGVQPHRFAHGLVCPRCRGTGAARRLYPWGNEAPTPERCVSAAWDEADARARNLQTRTYADDPSGEEFRRWRLGRRSSVPVRDAEGRPARPLGASPCGAQDIGHVFEFAFVAPYVHELMGSSFRRQREDIITATADGADDLGFRVALSEPDDETMRRPEAPAVTDLLAPPVLVERRGRGTPSIWRRPRRGPTA